MADEKGAAGAGTGDGGAAAGAGADSGVSLLDPSKDQKTDGAGGGDSSAAAKAAADAAAAAAAGGKSDASSKTGDEKKDALKGAPEKYETFKVPQGVTLDPEVVKEFEPLAKELGLNQEQAQKLVDLQTKVGQKAVEQQMKVFNDTKKGWEDGLQKEFGAKFQTERALAAKGRDWIADPEMVKLLNESGLGSHPAIFKAFAKLGKAIAEDSFVEGKSAGSGGEDAIKPAAEVLFGKTTPPKK